MHLRKRADAARECTSVGLAQAAQRECGLQTNPRIHVCQRAKHVLHRRQQRVGRACRKVGCVGINKP
ncbi:hypothetical protein B0H19DRAFT_1202674, partial [Mycena capillaripes]